MYQDTCKKKHHSIDLTVTNNFVVVQKYTPVSYTHLDVYKRQFLNSVNSGNDLADMDI